jgi:hypothetical protein
MANTARAYILIECTVGRTKEVVTGLARLKGMKSVETVTGPYDVIAIVELATQHIHPITGITRTVTCLVV